MNQPNPPPSQQLMNQSPPVYPGLEQPHAYGPGGYPNSGQGYAGGGWAHPQQPVIIVRNGRGPANSGACPLCQAHAPVVDRKHMGCAIWGWGCALLWVTGFCFWVPCCISECYDKEFICTACKKVRYYSTSPYGC